MKTPARPRHGAAGEKIENPTNTDRSSTTCAAAVQVDLPALRDRLCGARRRLVERLAEDYPADRRFPDSGWSRLLADIQIVITAVDALVAEDGP